MFNNSMYSQSKVVEYLRTNSSSLIEKQLIRQKEEELAMHNKFMDFSSNTMANLTSNFLLDFNKDGLIKELRYFFNISTIRGIVVYDGLINQVFLTLSKDKNKIQIDVNIENYTKTYQFIKKELFYEGEKIGYIVVYYDDANIKNKIKKMEKELFLKLKEHDSSIETIIENRSKEFIFT
ncbi:MAG: hypothetical protein U9Q33_05060, partial [Campylobacterota bacterium]|nr:hypothetical protein [Campylobacterota bacterium]